MTSETSWQRAEKRAAAHLVSLGFVDARCTAPGSDGGIDVIGTGVVAQVKDWARPVGEPYVRDLAGTAHASGALAVMYASSGYTAQARRWASDNGVALFQDGFGRFEPTTSTAHALTVNGAGPGARTLGLRERSRYRSGQAVLGEIRDEISRLDKRATSLTGSRLQGRQRKGHTVLAGLTHVRKALVAVEAVDPSSREFKQALKSIRKTLARLARML